MFVNMEHFYKNIDGWFDFESIYIDMVKRYPDGSHFVEIGVMFGKSTTFLATEIYNSGKKIKLDCVDIWGIYQENGVIGNSDTFWDGNEQKSILNKFKENISPFNDFVIPIKGFSTEIANRYADDSLDFVFINANHEYESVLNDIKSWFPKLKKDGVIAGHDYNMEGVSKAVIESFGEDLIKMNNRSWIVEKQDVIEKRINIIERSKKEDKNKPIILKYEQDFDYLKSGDLIYTGWVDLKDDKIYFTPLINFEDSTLVIKTLDDRVIFSLPQSNYNELITYWFIPDDKKYLEGYSLEIYQKEKLIMKLNYDFTRIKQSSSDDMKICLYTMMIDEEIMIPFTLDYYINYVGVNKVVIYDGGSTDSSIEIAKKYPQVEIIHQNDDYTDSFRDLKIWNHDWKKYRNDFDWMIVCTPDEFLYHPNLRNKLLEYQKNGITIPKVEGFDMISIKHPIFTEGNYLPYQIKKGIKNSITMNKNIIFNPRELDINFRIGCHACNPVGNVVFSEKEELKLLHFQKLSYENFISESARKDSRRSQWMIDHGAGFHYAINKNLSFKTYKDEYDSAIDVINDIEKNSDKKKEKDIHIFSHNYLINDWGEILIGQIQKIKNSGLYSVAKNLHFCAYGNDNDWKIFESIIKKFDTDNKVIIIRHEDNFFEYRTLQYMWDFIQSYPEECYITYFHLKGVWSRHNLQTDNDDKYNSFSQEKNPEALKQWRDCLEYFTLERWNECVNKLNEGYDTVGPLYNYNQECPLYTGNFWWAKSNHIKNLERLDFVNDQEPYHVSLWVRVKCEKWINSMPHKFYNLYIPRDLDLYHVIMRPNEYRDDLNNLKQKEQIPILIFYHCYLINNWKEIVDEQLFLMKQSGLYENSTKISIAVIYHNEQQIEQFNNIVKKYDNLNKFNIKFSNQNTYEFQTLYDIKTTCEKNDCHICYFHTKGVFSEKIIENRGVRSWRKYLNHFIITKWKDNIEALLSNHDICGVNYEFNTMHNKHVIGGNFFWVNSDYVKSLPYPNINNDRFVLETWITSNDTRRVYELFNTKNLNYNNLYIEYLPILKYRNPDDEQILEEIWWKSKNYYYIQQKELEWKKFLKYNLSNKKQKLNALEIGCYNLGSTHGICELYENVISIDIEKRDNWDKFEEEHVNWKYFIGDSHSIDVHNSIKQFNLKFDLIMIDGDHTYNGVKKVFEYYKQYLEEDGIIAMHDILNTEFHIEHNCFVHDYWKEINKKYDYIEIIDDSSEIDVLSSMNQIPRNQWGGIGIVKNINKNNNMKYSFITPTYNRHASLKKSIDSVIAQNYSNWEILICSDGEDKMVETIITEYNDERIKYFYTKSTNFFGTHQRNYLLEKTTGDYIIFLDDDNYLYPNHLEIINQNIENSDMLIYHINFESYQYSVIPLVDKIIHEQIDSLNFVIKRELSTRYKWRKIYEHDYIYFKNIEADIVENNGIIKYIPDILAIHRDKNNIEIDITETTEIKNEIDKNSLVYIITSHPSYRISEEITKKVLEKIKFFGEKIILSSHCPIGVELQKLADVCVYDKNNPLIKHDFYTNSWFNTNDYFAHLQITKLDNNLNHALGVFLNYYNSIILAKSLGYKMAVCTNFDMVFSDQDKLIIDQHINLLNNSGKKAFFMNTPETEGIHYKTIFFITNIDFFIDTFKYLIDEKTYIEEIKKVGSNTNCLENFFYHSLKNKTSELLLEQINEKDLFPTSEINLFSLIEYGTILPVDNESDNFVFWFSSANSLDNRELRVKIKKNGTDIYQFKDFIKKEYVFFKKIKYSIDDIFEINYQVYDKMELLKNKTITVNREVFNDLKSYGRFVDKINSKVL